MASPQVPRGIAVLLVVLLSACLLLTVWGTVVRPDRSPATIPVSQLIEDARSGRVRTIEMRQGRSDVVIRYKDGPEAHAVVADPTTLLRNLQGAGVDVSDGEPQVIVSAGPDPGSVLSFLGQMLLVFLVGLIVLVGLGLLVVAVRRRS